MLKPENPLTLISLLTRIRDYSPLLVLFEPSRNENRRQGPKLAPARGRARRVQNQPERYRLRLLTNRLAHQAHRKLDGALASEQKRLRHAERIEAVARPTRAIAKVFGEGRSGEVPNDHERFGVED